MNRKSIILGLSVAAAIASACTPQAGKTLVVYYSQTGTTQKVAEQFAAQLGENVDVVSLECVKAYPDDYQATIEESRDEVIQDTGRELVNGKIDLKQYDTIYIGFPIWYGTYAPPVVTLARENNLFAGKDVVLFCTYGSGGRKAAEKNFKDMCPDANVIASYGISARKVDIAEEDVKAFLEGLAAGQDNEQMVGAYSDFRPLEEDDLEVFNKATEGYDYLHLQPLAVATQVVAGLNYIFNCATAGPDGNASECEVFIFRPLNGDPYLKAVER